MRRLLSLVVSIVLTVAVTSAQGANSISLLRDGWTVTADGEQGVLRITQDKLGTVMKDARLNLQGEHGLRGLRKWVVEKKGENQLSVKTTEPPTA